MKARGFTLIELMVSMALFGLIAAGAMTLVMSGARSQAHSARVDVAQSALRAGIDFITRDVMMTSAGAGGGTLTDGSGTHYTVRFDVAANNSSTGPDTLELWLVDGSPAAQLAAAASGGATSLSITYEQNATTTFAASTNPYQSYVQLCDTNFANAVVTKLTSASGTTLGIGALPGAGFAANAWVLPSKHVVYSIGQPFGNLAGVTANNNMLMMSVNGAPAQPLAEGVEDLQVAYGFDTNGDGVLTDNGNTSDEWLYNAAGDSAASFNIAQLRAIRVTLIATGTTVDNGALQYGARPAAEDRAAASGTDGFIRRVLRTEIAVRNFNL